MSHRAARNLCLVASVLVLGATTTVLGAGSALAAPSTQANFVDYAQCANDPPPSTSLACPSGWINGILQGSNSHYHEDEVTPQRAEVEVPKGSPATGRTLTFKYQARKGGVTDGIHAYDSLTTWNLTQSAADRCLGLTAVNCVPGPATTFPIPADPTPVGPGADPVTSNHSIPGVMTMYGGSITAISTPVHDNAAGAGDDYATITVTYSVATTTAAKKVQLLFGGHLAPTGGTRGWGPGLGSSNISGGPYHIKFDAADGASIGGRDNQIQAAAILAQSSLSVTKTADASPVAAGSPIGFTVTVTNNGTGNSVNTTLSDPLPSGTGIDWSISPAYAGPGTCSIAGAPPSETLNCSFGTLAPGASASVHVTSNTTATTSGTFNNTATAMADNNPPVVATASVTVNQPALAVTKTADNATVNAGSQIGFTITVTNNGQATATNATLSDPLPGGAGIDWSISPAYAGPGTCGISGTPPNPETLTCSFGNLAPTASASVHVISATTAATSGTKTNTATAQASNNPPISATATVTVNQPSLAVTKTADNATVNAGSQIGFTITVKNNGAGTATSATLSDPLPTATGVSWSISPAYTGPGTCAITGTPQVLNCSFGDLAPNASASVHVISATTAATSGTLSNTATAQATNNPPTTGTATVTVNKPSLAITKTADNATVSAGAPIGFTMTVTNGGPGTATNATLTDTLPSATGVSWSVSPAYTGPGTCGIAGSPQVLTCSFGDLAPTASASVHVTSNTTAATSGTLSNTATAQAANNPPVSASATVTVNQPALSVTKTADNATVNSGEQIGFTMLVKNNGAGTATNATLSDPLPTATGVNWSISPAYTGPGTCAITGTPQVLNCSFGNLAPTASASVHVVSNTTSATSGTISNTATAQAANNPPTSSTTTVTINQPSLAVTKTADNAIVSSGAPIGFTMTVTNGGPGTATNATLSDTLPSATGVSWSISPAYTGPGTCAITGTPQVLNCSFGNLAPGASASVHVSSNTTAATSGTLSNTATAQATNNPPTSSTATVTVNQPALAVTKTADNATVSSGDPIGFTMLVKNNGAGTATNATLSDPLPTATGVSWSISPAYTGPGTCAITGTPQVLNCSFGNLAPGASASVHVVSNTTSATSGTISNTATAQADNNPPTSSTTTVTINQPNLAVIKTADNATVSAGDPIGFTMTVKNNGAGTATNATLSDTLPTATGVSWSISPAYTGPGTCGIAAGPPQVLNCSFGNLAPGASASVHVVSNTTSATSGTISNTAVARADNNPPTETTTTVTVNQPNLAVTKTADNATVSAGDPIGFTVAVTNNGTGTATNATLSDTLPTATGVSWSISPAYTGPGTCAITGTPQVLNCSFGNLAGGASASVHVTSNTTAATSGTLTNTATAQAANNPPTSATATITVNQPHLTNAKSTTTPSVNPGDPINYTIVIGNTGPGTAKNVVVTDPLPGGPGINWSVNPAVPGCGINGSPPNQTLSCTFASLAPNASVTIKVVSNTTNLSCVTLNNTATVQADNNPPVTSGTAVTIVVNCKPTLAVTKVGCPVTSVVPGGLLTYTINYSNTGTAMATGATLVDTLPAGTEVADAGGGTVNGQPGSQTVTWSLGNLAVGATGTKTLVVLVNATGGSLTNTVTLSAANVPPAQSATGTAVTAVSNAGAITHGSAYGLDADVLILPLLNEVSRVDTVAPAAPPVGTADEDQVLSIGVLGVAQVNAVTDTSRSSVTNQAVSTSTSEVAGVNLLGGAITADVVKGVSQSVAGPFAATSNSAGSTFTNLKINGNSVTNIVPGQSITVKNPLLPSQNLASVVLQEETKTATFTNGKFTATHSINMLHVTLLKPLLVGLLTLPKGAEIIVAHANTDATYPSGLACGTSPSTVSGNAFSALANGTFLGNTFVNAQTGDASITPFGGSDSDGPAVVTVPGFVLAGAATNTASGSLVPNPNSTANSRITGANVLGGIVTADVLDVTSTSNANGTTASTNFTTTFTNVQVHIPGVAQALVFATVAPNTTLRIPVSGGILILVLNEQIRGGNGTKDTEGTINAVHGVVLDGSNLITAEVIVASAHSDAHKA